MSEQNLPVFTHLIKCDGSIGKVEVTVNPNSHVPIEDQVKDSVRALITDSASASQYASHPELGRAEKRQLISLVLQTLKKTQEEVLNGSVSLPAGQYSEFTKQRVIDAIDSSEIGQESISERLQDEIDAIIGDSEYLADQINDVITSYDHTAQDCFDWLLETTQAAVKENDRTSPESWLEELSHIRLIHESLPANASCALSAPLKFEREFASASDVVPDEAFLNFLKLFNVPGAKYIDAVRRICGEDLTDSQTPHAVIWRRLANSMEPANYLGMPAATANELVEMVDNAYTCSNPTVVVNVPLEVLMAASPSDTITVNGGLAGLYDSVNGAGSLDRLKGTLCVPALLDQWSPDFGEIDEVFGFVPDVFVGHVALQPKGVPQMDLELSYG